MKKQSLTLLLLTFALALAGCSSAPIVAPPVVAQCPTLDPAPEQAMVPRKKLSQDQLRQDLLDDTPTTTKSSTS